MEDVRDF